MVCGRRRKRINRVRFTVSPAAAGVQVVRASLPLPPGFLGTNQACVVTTGSGKPEPVALRVLSWHSPTNAGPAPHAARS